MGGVLFLDISPKSTGYCVGDGREAPVADAWPPIRSGGDYGALADDLTERVVMFAERYDLDAAGYESPILRSHDKLHTLRRIYGLGMVFEQTCREIGRRRGRPFPCGELGLQQIKHFATGDRWSDKKFVTAAAVDAGIPILPRTIEEGRYDAGDAAVGWVILLHDVDPAAASPWVARFKGGLL